MTEHEYNKYHDSPVYQYIGDFYEGNANRDTAQMEASLSALQRLLASPSSREAASHEFLSYFNDMYRGRSAYNTLLNVVDYPVESIVRELLQNAFDCYYAAPDIKLTVNFLSDNRIVFAYNEKGFTLEEFLYYLSFGRNNGDRAREGRFGVGAKSVFINVERLHMRSNGFSFTIANNHGLLKIEEINLKSPLYKGTEITIQVDTIQYGKIKENFETLIERKGEYINLVELCFALNRKKVLDSTQSLEECRDRSINIAVLDNSRLVTAYKVQKHVNAAAGIETVRFMQNGRSVVDFICYEREGFVYLIPFAVATSLRKSLIRVLLGKYNYFSTYELTGFLKTGNERFLNEKLSAFFISVPNRYITTYRTGIRHDSEHEVTEQVEKGLLALMKEYARYFVLELAPLEKEEGKYFLRPESYAFEFVKNFILTSSLARGLRVKFQDSVMIRYPGEDVPVPYREVVENGFARISKDVSRHDHESGKGYRRWLVSELEALESALADTPDKTLYAAYEWVNDDISASDSISSPTSGREFIYKFCRGGKTYIFDSASAPGYPDYNLSYHFQSLTHRLLSQSLRGSSELADENDLEEVFALFDRMYGSDYCVRVRYFQLYFMHDDEKHVMEFSHIKVGDLVRVMEILAKHQNRFDTYQAYNDTARAMFEAFCEGKETIDFLKEIKAQGGEVTLQLDLNNRYRFSVYGEQIIIPQNVTNSQMLEVIGDVNILIKNGMLGGREFDFAHFPGRYAVEAEDIAGLLKEIDKEKIEQTLKSIYVCDLKIDRIALLDSDDRILDIVDSYKGISEEMRENTSKYVILRDDSTKPEYAEYLEVILLGRLTGELKNSYMRARKPNLIIPDQVAFYLKPMLPVTMHEFEFLRGVVRSASTFEQEEQCRNCYAKDINFKLFGYGAACPVCGYEADTVNGFGVKDFKVGVLCGEREVYFNFSLYLCANDRFVSDGWVFEDISIGGMTPFLWLEEITQIREIPPEFMFCRLKYREQVSYDMYTLQPQGLAASVKRDIILTPLMAAKWVEDNLPKLS